MGLRDTSRNVSHSIKLNLFGEASYKMQLGLLPSEIPGPLMHGKPSGGPRGIM